MFDPLVAKCISDYLFAIREFAFPSTKTHGRAIDGFHNFHYEYRWAVKALVRAELYPTHTSYTLCSTSAWAQTVPALLPWDTPCAAFRNIYTLYFLHAAGLRFQIISSLNKRKYGFQWMQVPYSDQFSHTKTGGCIGEGSLNLKLEERCV